MDGSKTTILNLSMWESTFAPDNLWKFYWKDGSFLDYVPYVPGLGFHEYSKGKSFFSIHTRETSDLLKKLQFPAGKSAGTDCLGFVQRATSYAGNKYAWNVNSILPRDRAEKNHDPDLVERTDKRGLMFPRSGENCDLIVDSICLILIMYLQKPIIHPGQVRVSLKIILRKLNLKRFARHF